MCLPSCETELTVGIFAREESRGATAELVGLLALSKVEDSKFVLLRWSCTVASEFANVINVSLTKHCASMRGA